MGLLAAPWALHVSAIGFAPGEATPMGREDKCSCDSNLADPRTIDLSIVHLFEPEARFGNPT